MLLRHGPAGSRDAGRWPDDALRPLTPRGRARSVEVAHGLVRLERGIACIATSPLLRAAQTARALAELLEDVEPEELDALAPGGAAERTLEFLDARRAPGTIVLVGHEPDLGALAGRLLFDAPVALPLRKAGACAVTFEAGIRAGRGRLSWLLPPRALRRLAKRRDRV